MKALIRWRLSEVMARHRVKGKDLAEAVGISNNALYSLRNAEVMPRIDGERLESLCKGISSLSRVGGTITPFDLLEYIPDGTDGENGESSVAVVKNRSASIAPRASRHNIQNVA